MSNVAHGPKKNLVSYSYDAGVLGPEDVEISIEHCGLCHSDLSMVNNGWGLSHYPIIPGHEVIGRVVAKGDLVKGLQIMSEAGLRITLLSSPGRLHTGISSQTPVVLPQLH